MLLGQQPHSPTNQPSTRAGKKRNTLHLAAATNLYLRYILSALQNWRTNKERASILVSSKFTTDSALQSA